MHCLVWFVSLMGHRYVWLTTRVIVWNHSNVNKNRLYLCLNCAFWNCDMKIKDNGIRQFFLNYNKCKIMIRFCCETKKKWNSMKPVNSKIIIMHAFTSKNRLYKIFCFFIQEVIEPKYLLLWLGLAWRDWPATRWGTENLYVRGKWE